MRTESEICLHQKNFVQSFPPNQSNGIPPTHYKAISKNTTHSQKKKILIKIYGVHNYKYNPFFFTYEIFLKKNPVDTSPTSKTYRQLTWPTKTNCWVIHSQNYLFNPFHHIWWMKEPKYNPLNYSRDWLHLIDLKNQNETLIIFKN